MDLVVTTVTHAEEVEQMLGSAQKLARVALRLRPSCVGQIVKLPENAAVAVLGGSLRYGDLLRQACAGYTDDVMLLQPRQLGSAEGCGDLLEKVQAVVLPEGFERYCTTLELEQLHEFHRRGLLLRCAHQIDEGSLMYVEDKIQRLRSVRRI